MSIYSTDSGNRTLLLVAHPGHELLLHHWMERQQPQVFILTDGSDFPECDLLEHSMNQIEATGSSIGDLFGRFTEAGFLQAMLSHDHDRFLCLAEELAEILVDLKIETVVAEAAEQLLPGADVARLLIDTATAIASKMSHSIQNYEFSIQPLFGMAAPKKFAPAARITLDSSAWDRKWEAWKSNPRVERHTEVLSELENDLQTETMQLALNWSILRAEERRDETCPIGSGYVAHGLSFREHLLPLGEALRKMANRGRLAIS